MTYWQVFYYRPHSTGDPTERRDQITLSQEQTPTVEDLPAGALRIDEVHRHNMEPYTHVGRMGTYSLQRCGECGWGTEVGDG